MLSPFKALLTAGLLMNALNTPALAIERDGEVRNIEQWRAQRMGNLTSEKAYNPPCAFNELATCPLPPQQNRLKNLRVTAGEKTYGEHR